MLLPKLKTNTNSLRQVTLLFLIKEKEVLLAMKKRGFGEGFWNGAGGKPMEGESLEQAAVRETVEEVGCSPINLTKVAVFNFYFPLKLKESNYNQQVVVFLAKQWIGEPTESEEMRPQWFNFNEIPYESMWPDDKYWLPKILQGKLLKGEFAFAADGSIQEYNLNEVSSL